jgi:L-aspartate oxidase
MKNHYYHDVLIIGSGAAGLTLALSLSKYAKIALLSKSTIDEGNTIHAQGGIAAVVTNEDSIESHIEDTLIAGAGLCDKDVVSFVATNAKDAIYWLIKQGVSFTTTDGNNFHLTREGGHSRRRVLHAADATGAEVETNLVKQLKKTPIDIFTEHTAINLIKQKGRCTGAYVLDNLQNRVKTFQAKFIVLATGGASKVYLYTTNPDCSSGDGIAMAWRAGCNIANMEFNQFHPTCLYHPYAKSFLISEAVRGEGGKLVLPDGNHFMSKFDKRAELAPRDIVTRAIDFEMKRLGIDCVYLDISHKPENFIKEHFPNIHKRCLELGIDITKNRIPVVPAAHYTCGGVVVDKRGRTNIPGLYALGETSCTGLHGANRIASNSLLECIVYGKAASDDIRQQLPQTELPTHWVPWDEGKVTDSDEAVVVTHNWGEVRRLMWNYVGIVCTNKRLERARRRIELLKSEVQEYYCKFKVSKSLIELRNLVVIADIIINAATARKKNCGLYYNLDHITQKNVPSN